MSEQTFFSIDIETNGLCPGVNALLSLGAVAFDPITGEDKGEFYAKLAPMPTVFHPDPDTMKWWEKFPDQYAEATTNAAAPHLVMGSFRLFVEKASDYQITRPVAVYWKPDFDGAFIRYYSHVFCGRDIFSRSVSGLCIKTLTALALGKSYADTKVGDVPREWTGSTKEHSHNALEDAREQKNIYMSAIRKLNGVL